MRDCWFNYFGAPYRELMTRERLASAPAWEASNCGTGYTLKLSERLEDWTLPKYKVTEQMVRRHLGEQFFFGLDSSQRETVSPFELSKLPAPRFSIEADVDRESTIQDIRIRERRE